jgi:hypothetical protein
MLTRSLRFLLMLSSVACALAYWSAIARAQEFSAELVTTKSGGQASAQPGRLYVSRDKVRIETPDFADNFFIVDGQRESVWFVRPRQWVFMDAKQSSPLTQIFVAVNPSDPCRQWHLMDTIAGATDQTSEWRCERLGDEIIEGHHAIKYRVIPRANQRSDRWIDPEREFPIRLENEDGTIVTVRNVVDAPQPANLFVIPPAYKKFDPMQLIQQMMQSDVGTIRPPG